MTLSPDEVFFLHQMEDAPHLRVPIREMESLPLPTRSVTAGKEGKAFITVRMVEDITTLDQGLDDGPRGAICIVSWKGLNPQDRHVNTTIVTLATARQPDMDGAIVVRRWRDDTKRPRYAWTILDLMRAALELA